MNTQSLYEKDFYAWTVETVNQLRSRQLNKIDIDHLAEEVESMGASEKRALESRFVVLIMHLLKWHIQKSERSNSWVGTIETQRLKIKRILKNTPSLRNNLYQLVDDADIYKEALIEASMETGLSRDKFPSGLPYTIEQILDDNFYPDNPDNPDNKE